MALQMEQVRSTKRKRTVPPGPENTQSQSIKPVDLFHRVAERDLEDEYNRRKRRKDVKESNKLPTKNIEGAILQAQTREDSEDCSEDTLTNDGETDDEREQLATPPPDRGSQQYGATLVEQLAHVKEEIARLAGLLTEDPEEHAGSFKKLAHIVNTEAHPSLQKLALAAQTAVYKDVIPGYRIRAYRDEDLSGKISKEIRQTRQYEQALIMGYQAFVQRLSTLTKRGGKTGDVGDLRTTALSCTCTLLLSVPHFNFRNDLLKIIARELFSREPTPNFLKAVDTLDQFFRDDEDGAPSLEAVNILAKLLKAKDYQVREEVLNTFLHLRLLVELSAKASMTQVSKDEVELGGTKLHGKKSKKERQRHMTKKERKIVRDRKVVEKDMQEARAEVDYEASEKLQSETLKVVFVIYFRILKARTPHLIGATLEGLAKFSHLINQDFFGDILEVLKDIIAQADSILTNYKDDGGEGETTAHDQPTSRGLMRECLLASQTAFTLLSKQEVSKSASSLSLDLSFFTSYVYRSLPILANDACIELGPNSLHLQDSNLQGSARNQATALKTSKINVQTPILLLTRVLNTILLAPHPSTATPITIAAFFKRILTSLLSTPERSSLSLLSLLQKVVSKHGKRSHLEALWYSDERKGDGVYKGDADSVDGTRVFSLGSGVWEGELLKKHYAADVRDNWAQIEMMAKT